MSLGICSVLAALQCLVTAVAGVRGKSQPLSCRCNEKGSWRGGQGLMGLGGSSLPLVDGSASHCKEKRLSVHGAAPMGCTNGSLRAARGALRGSETFSIATPHHQRLWNRSEGFVSSSAPLQQAERAQGGLGCVALHRAGPRDALCAMSPSSTCSLLLVQPLPFPLLLAIPLVIALGDTGGVFPFSPHFCAQASGDPCTAPPLEHHLLK